MAGAQTSIRGLLYLVARVLGDISAIRKGRITERIANRAMGKVAGRVMGKVWR